MESTLDVKLLLKYLVDGDLERNLCRICLQPHNKLCESIFTRICKEDQEYCIADVLEVMLGFQFLETDNYFVCIECFVKASDAYNFFLKTKQNNEILSFYVNELENNLNAIPQDIPDTVLTDSLCISLPEFIPETPDFNYSLDGILNRPPKEDSSKLPTNITDDKEKQDFDDHIVIIKAEDGEQSFFKILPDGNLLALATENKKHKEVVKKRKKREPMLYKQCSRCPIKYRFISKLKDHMRNVHGVNLHACKICQALIEDEDEFRQHLKTHTNIHQCELCDTVFRKRATMIAHIKWHEKNADADGNHVCKDCGAITASEEELKEHCALHHDKQHTCYYCGRMYKGATSFERHIAKHETYLRMKDAKSKSDKRGSESKKMIEEPKKEAKKLTCETCGRNFLGERALRWHYRLHTNERPYACQVCGKGFVSENRRKQHALCAHTVPTRRCPLCPALFHLRSIVNTHIKKVHLKAHKRRNRTVRPQEVLWETQPVPIQELSISIQNEILELQAAREKEALEIASLSHLQ